MYCSQLEIKHYRERLRRGSTTLSTTERTVINRGRCTNEDNKEFL